MSTDPVIAAYALKHARIMGAVAGGVTGFATFKFLHLTGASDTLGGLVGLGVAYVFYNLGYLTYYDMNVNPISTIHHTLR